MNNKIFKFICSGFGIGYIPIFPGTIASFVILFPVWFFKDNFDKAYLILLILILLFLSERLISKIIKYEENKDPKFIVIDEFIGQASALVFCNQLIIDYLLALVGFRVLDIFKPFLVNYFD